MTTITTDIENILSAEKGINAQINHTISSIINTIKLEKFQQELYAYQNGVCTLNGRGPSDYEVSMFIENKLNLTQKNIKLLSYLI